MALVFVVFPPGGGGNHLKNIVASCYDAIELSDVYKDHKKTVHAHVGNNLQRQQVEDAVNHQNQIHVLHGHFGEVMSFQQEIRNIADKKFVVISPETPDDRKLLNNRRKGLGYASLVDDDYFDHEQVFLYECFMYHQYFQVPLDCIMNISISELFTEDITPAINRLEFLLQIPINKEKINNMHTTWIKANQKWVL
jgi:hypothetical protein